MPFPGIKNNRQRVASRKDGPPCLGILCPLSFSLVVGGLKLEVRFIVTANGALLGGVLANYDITALQARDKSLVITYQYDSVRHYHVNADELRIEQVLVILLDNAMRYAGEGGTIRIGARQDANDIYVSVWDSGCGISPEDMVHVFERFYKTDKSRKEGGTGLGLSIAKQIMEKLDEQITVQSEVGQWTCFTFTVKKYVSNAIALGPVDTAAIVYTDLANDQPAEAAGEKDTLDAPFEVLKQDKKPDKPWFKDRVIKKKESK